MSCKCINEMNKLLKKGGEGLELDVAHNFSAGMSYPAMQATNEGTRKKGEKKLRRFLIPTFCPMCGKTVK